MSTAWEDLVREHHALVAGVAARVLGDRVAAEDVAQDLFLHLLQNPHALDKAQNVRSFLCRAAINRSLDRIRERDRRERREAAVPAPQRDADPMEAAFRDEVRRTVEALPQGERDAVDARYFRGLTVREAAKEMHVSVGTVCNRLEAGLTRLRKWLGAAAFALLFAVLDDEAFADASAPGVLDDLVRKGRAGPPVSPAKTRGVRTAAGVASVAALLLFSLWIGRPGDIPSPKRPPVEMAKATEAGVPPQEMLDPFESPAGTQFPAASAHPDSRPLGASFRAEGFLAREGDMLSLVSPDVRNPQLASGAMPDGALLSMAAASFVVDAVTDPAGRPFHFAPSPLTRNLPIGAARSFDGWLDGAADDSDLPRAFLTAKLAWLDEARGEATLVSVEDAEILSTDWLRAWRDALAANSALAAAFKLAPGPLRRAEALAAADRLEESLASAKAARKNETSVSWRTRRESEIEIASAGALACLGREEALPDDPDDYDPESLAAAREIGLELEPVPAIQGAAMALRGGARVLSVAPGSPAERAGLMAGDIVWRIAPSRQSTPRDVRRPEDVASILDEAAAASWADVEFEVVRGMDALVIALKLRG